jgi:CRISPR-associated protein Cmr3
MAWDLYEIEALDTLFFRDGRPFNAGEDVEAHGVFPPSPMTVQGLVRSLLLSELGAPTAGKPKDTGCGQWELYQGGCSGCQYDQNCDAQKIVGRLPRNDAGSLLLHGPYLRVHEQIVLPTPADLVVTKKDANACRRNRSTPVTAKALRPDRKPACSNMPGALRPLCSPFGNEKFEAVEGWISPKAFREYLERAETSLTRDPDNQNWWLPLDLWTEERRSGHEVDRERNRPTEGMLYFARHTRPHKGVTLAFEVDGCGTLSSHLTNFPASPFGGERRGIVTRKLARWTDLEEPGQIKTLLQSKRQDGTLPGAKLVYVQPAWFPDGWIPRGWSAAAAASADAAGCASFSGLSCPWIAACIVRPERMGGWDLAHNRQKPIRSFVRPGSVYYLEMPDEDARNAVLSLWNTCLTETPDDEPFAFGSFGMGHVFVGTW